MKLADEFDVLGADIVERGVDVAAAEHLDFEIFLFAGSAGSAPG